MTPRRYKRGRMVLQSFAMGGDLPIRKAVKGRQGALQNKIEVTGFPVPGKNRLYFYPDNYNKYH